MIGHEVADRGAGAFELRLFREVDDQDIEFLVVGRCVRAKPLIPLDVVLEGVLDVLGVPTLRFGLVNAIEQVDGEVAEPGLVERLD
ncbi:MAG: hypothetical protein ACHBNF_05300 [Chromatiales bacterium]